MQALRQKYPYHIPCRVSVPENCTLKLLMPADATIAVAMQAVRRKWPGTALSSADALFCFHKHAICIGNTRIKALDTNQPDEVQLVVRKENTFG